MGRVGEKERGMNCRGGRQKNLAGETKKWTG